MIGMFVGNENGGEIFWIDVKGRKGSDSCAAADAEVDEDLCFSRVQIDTISAASAVKRAKQCHGKLLSYDGVSFICKEFYHRMGGLARGQDNVIDCGKIKFRAIVPKNVALLHSSKGFEMFSV